MPDDIQKEEELLTRHPEELEVLKESGDIKDYSLYDTAYGEYLEITFLSGKTLKIHNWGSEYNCYLDFTETSHQTTSELK